MNILKISQVINMSIIYTDNKMLNLYHLLLNIYSDNDDVYITLCPNTSIKVASRNENTIKEITNLNYFKNNGFNISQAIFNFSPHLFYITYSLSYSEIKHLETIYDDYLEIYNMFNINISMISEYGFMIENPSFEQIEQINEKYHEKYNITKIGNNFIMLIKEQINLESINLDETNI